MEEKNKEQTIQELFKTTKNIRVPAYQRAYSWEEKHCKQYLEDIIEQKGKDYYLGQFLFEREGEYINVIDGQQRLTTTVLFLSAIAKIKSDRKSYNGELGIYLSNVFETISDDQLIFKEVTQKHSGSKTNKFETASKKRIVEAFFFFIEQIKNLQPKEIESLQEVIENAVISTFYIKSKVQATQVFEYQNNRGKELSRFEVIKAYLMHQVYLQNATPTDENEKIKEIQVYISKINRDLEKLEGYFTEIDLLDSFSYLRYGIKGTNVEIKEKLSQEDNKIQWILSFFQDFCILTDSATQIVGEKNDMSILNLFFLGNKKDWKIILLVMACRHTLYHEKAGSIFKLLEILCFKLKLGDYRTDILPSIAKDYYKSGDIEKLFEVIKTRTEIGFRDGWNEKGKFENIVIDFFDIRKHHYDYRAATKFVLWQYENKLRKDNRSGALMDKEQYDNYTIEHICPRTPKKGKEHPEDFQKKFLHLAGNLALLTKSQNSSFNNKPFEEKRELFQDTALSSYTEIREKTEWGEAEINERHEKISKFAKEYFDTSKC